MPRRYAVFRLALAVAGLFALPDSAGMGSGIGPVANGALPGPFPLFPATNWWNLDVGSAPVDPSSAAFIAFINNGGTRRLHPDFGGDVSPGSTQIYGMPYAVVDATQPKKAVRFQYWRESDGVDPATGAPFPFYPIPDEAITQAHWIEGGEPGNQQPGGDRHLLIVDRDNKYLYELFALFFDGVEWHAGSGAFFDMKTNNRRPETWTSADAAGLAILPGLVRYDEVYGPSEIGHAFRVSVRATNGYVYPASHSAGSNSQALPMGARLRLKASKDISGFPADAQKIFRAMKKYGLIVADNGSDMYITGTYDNRWDNSVLNPAFAGLSASDFDVVQRAYQGAPPPPAVAASFYTLTPCRLVDTRAATGPLGGPALSAGSDRAFTVAGICGIPASARALAVNVTVTASTGGGYLTLRPGGSGAAVASTVNYNAGATRANSAVVLLGAAGDVLVSCGQPSGTAHVVIDATGYFQ